MAGFAEQDTGVVNLQELLKGRSLVGMNSYFALVANASTAPMEMPGSGTASFKLHSHEGIITDTATQARLASTASDASLKIDFGARRFETSMTVSAGAVSIPIQATGAVEANGNFASQAFIYPTAIQGIVGGSQASQAVYLYQRSIKGYDASGVASWLK